MLTKEFYANLPQKNDWASILTLMSIENPLVSFETSHDDGTAIIIMNMMRAVKVGFDRIIITTHDHDPNTYIVDLTNYLSGSKTQELVVASGDCNPYKFIISKVLLGDEPEPLYQLVLFGGQKGRTITLKATGYIAAIWHAMFILNESGTSVTSLVGTTVTIYDFSEHTLPDSEPLRCMLYSLVRVIQPVWNGFCELLQRTEVSMHNSIVVH